MGADAQFFYYFITSLSVRYSSVRCDLTPVYSIAVVCKRMGNQQNFLSRRIECLVSVAARCQMYLIQKGK